MQSTVYVTASGPALSLLLYENTKTASHQMGFLLGAVVNQVTDTISDSQMRGEKTETIINISSILPIPICSNVIDGSGKINKEKLSAIVNSEKNQQLKTGSQRHDIVGWYCFYRNSAYVMSMRQRVIHLQLAKMSKELSQDSAPELFVMCLLLNNMTSKATHVFKHSFMRYIEEKRSFDFITLQIHNLGMTQLSQYQNLACPPSRAALLRQLFGSISPEQQGKDHMLRVQSELQILLKNRVRQLSTAESNRIKLESEVQKLQEALGNLQREQQTKWTAASQSLNNRSEESVAPDSHKQSLKENKERNCRNEDGDVIQNPSHASYKAGENSNDFDRTSPVLGCSQRRRASSGHS